MRTLLSDPDGRADLILAVCVWVFAATFYVSASQLPPPLFDPVGSAFFPKAISALVAVLALLMLIRRAFVLNAKSDRPPEAARIEEFLDLPLRPGLGVACILVMAGYVGLMASGLLGFREATVPFVVLLGAILSHFNRTSLFILLASGLAIAVGFSWLFSEVLYIDLPVSKWLAG